MIWHLKRLKSVEYYENSELIVRAEYEERARVLASKVARREGKDCWLNRELTVCEHLMSGDVEGVIVVS